MIGNTTALRNGPQGVKTLPSGPKKSELVILINPDLILFKVNCCRLEFCSNVHWKNLTIYQTEKFQNLELVVCQNVGIFCACCVCRGIKLLSATIYRLFANRDFATRSV